MKKIVLLILLYTTLLFSDTTWTIGAYTENENRSKVLSIHNANHLIVHIIGRTEQNYDFISIKNKDGKELGKYSGNINETLTVIGSSITVTFTSDYSNNDTGVTVSIRKNTESSGQPTITDIPDIMRLKGWDFAAKLLDRWFEGKGGIYYTDLGILRKKFSIIKDAYDEYANDAYDNTLYVTNTMLNPLIESLKKLDNGKGGKVIPDGGEFNFIDSEISIAGNNSQWTPSIYQNEKNNLNWFGEKTLSHWSLDEYTAAFNKSVLRIVPNGEVVVNSNGTVSINILEIGIYLRDSYDFTFPKEGEEDQELACWSFESPYVAHPYLKYTLTNPLCVSNKSFREYNIKNGRNVHYGNYRIFSTIGKYHKFYTNLSFEYTIPNNNNRISKYINQCISTYSNYFGSKNGGLYTCYTKYTCQDTNGKISKIAINKNLDDNKFYYYWNGWSSLDLDNCK
jgi:hypothetical protein